MFETLRRQQFRRHFQPSRIMIALVPAPTLSGVNPITLCFLMHCSYKPPMIAFAIHDVNWSCELFRAASECVLAVPGESLAAETLECGVRSGREVDKVDALGLRLCGSREIGVPGLADCVANVETEVVQVIATGDHLTVVSRVRRYGVNRHRHERTLLSVGPEHEGYGVLAGRGIHRIGVPGRATRS
jgi:flavin reductase (DIM6/NTAB) family NADH-FMN oxidoreductase RutF